MMPVVADISMVDTAAVIAQIPALVVDDVTGDNGRFLRTARARKLRLLLLLLLEIFSVNHWSALSVLVGGM